ncbi:putative transcriptional regulator, ArsR family [Halorhabdus utahensis DSM 12940]|uniref:Putative transcriptional regulator, ArsR family n=1 Tax=Halorhabdus utahensis (strain DSM 12940 / JCM 11049 / AX-2) TaxID=519442 RepID=C7NUJ0_HALUD|nr:helix-turn-helix domain-containing protein [Halorhabdus utahensis]ACV12347.1 putative transcriptional regulator, ArsR family [Halorhabdus utahensis DSM 12940]
MSQFDRTKESGHESGAGTETGPGPARTESRIPPAEVFSILGNDTRVAILQAMLELGADEQPVSFTAIFEQVDMADSANFSYHLEQLTGHFLAQREDGYVFRYPGRKVVSSIFTGTLTERAQLGFFPVEGSCYDCEGPLHGWYVDDELTIGCTDCGTIQVSYPFPAGGLDDRSTEDVLEAFQHYVRHHYCLAADGVCPECTGSIESDLVTDPEEDALDVAVEHVCQRCGYRLESTVGITMLDVADVLVFFSKRGVDLNAEPFWHFDWCVSDKRTEIVDDEPLRVRLTLPCAGDELRVLLDETVSVIDTAVVERLPE